jgi:hypothetical protein
VTKTGCTFAPTPGTVTIHRSNITGVQFATPCSLGFPKGSTAFADQYIRNYPYGNVDLVGDLRLQEYKRPTLDSDGLYCKGYQETCLAGAPYYVPYPVYSGGTNNDSSFSCGKCEGLWNTIAYWPHYRPQFSLGKNIWADLINSTDTVAFDFTAYNGGWVTVADKIVVVAPLGNSVRSTNCPIPGLTTHWACNQLTWTYTQWGAGARKVYPGEIRPSYWGIVPTDDSTLNWETTVRARKKLDLNAIAYAGNGYVDSQFAFPETPRPVLDGVFGGGDGPNCLHSEECIAVTVNAQWDSRVKIEKISGEWYVFISGYATNDDGLIQNTADVVSDLSVLAGIGSVHDTMWKTIWWMDQLGISNTAHLVGHSLGALDVVTLYNLGYGKSAVGYSVPYVTPISAMYPRDSDLSGLTAGNRPVTWYTGINDPISNSFGWWGCMDWMHNCRVRAGIPERTCDTGGGFWTLNNPHDRSKYEWCANDLPW